MSNPLIIFLTALIPLVVGFIWYQPSLFGKAWMRLSNTRNDDMSKGRMFMTFGLVYVFGLMLTVIMMGITIHQSAIYSILANDPGMKDPNSEVSMMVKDFMGKYGNNFRTFKHGAFHGTLAALFLAMPVVGVISLFERKRFGYFAIHVGYWIVTFALIGGVVCQFIKM